MPDPVIGVGGLLTDANAVPEGTPAVVSAVTTAFAPEKSIGRRMPEPRLKWPEHRNEEGSGDEHNDRQREAEPPIIAESVPAGTHN
jgi:hypothetical protein